MRKFLAVVTVLFLIGFLAGLLVTTKPSWYFALFDIWIVLWFIRKVSDMDKPTTKSSDKKGWKFYYQS